MSEEQFDIALSKYQQLEILRSELKYLEAEKEEVRSNLLDLLQEFEKAKFLASVSSHYSPEPPEANTKKDQITSYKTRINQIKETVESIKKKLTDIASETGIPVEEQAAVGSVAEELADKADDLKKFFKK